MIGENIPLIGLAAFMCCLGGILLWVSGGSSWYALRAGVGSGFTLSLAATFVLWLICYGLVGTLLSLIGVICKKRTACDRKCIRSFALVMLSYLLMLSWYAVFFCTRLAVFPIILLSTAVFLLGYMLVLMRKTLCILWVITVIIEIIQIYFIVFSIRLLC